ncbi:MAG TPA: hypothetical protein H9830_01780 [Candidatus Agrococcus pullicola]|uniref:Uncharacterized protein n=1 Tax=Candidatus Agrococcus pullicola TaxID=2838429 RepID=A0A9D1YW29_9MICO|nr:hypothetical protein [Candidatus Agrococcus pullicola]
MHVIARVTAAAAALVTGLSGLALPAPAQQDLTEQDADSLSVVVGAVEGRLEPGDDLDLALSIENGTSSDLRGATADLAMTYIPVDTRFAFDAWLDGDPVLGERPVTSFDVPDVPQGGDIATDVTIPADALGLSQQSTPGAYGLRITIGNVTTSTLLTVGAPNGPGMTLSLAAQISSEPDSTGLLSREQLTALTSNVGSLERQLRAVEPYPISVGIDPMIETSAYAVEGSAPAAAWSWIDRTYELEHPFHTSYARSDILAQLAADLTPLEPLGYPDESAQGGVTDGLPTILAGRGIIDATGRTIDADLLAAVEGYGVPLLSTEQLDEQLESPTPSSAVSVDGVAALAADQELQAMLDSAVSGESAADRSAATSELIALLATISREAPNSARALVGMLDPAGRGAEDVLRALEASGWVQLAPIDVALDAPAREASLVDAEAAELDIALQEAADSVHEDDARIDRYSEIADEPRSLRVPFRLSALAALHVTGATTGPSLERQVRSFSVLTDELLESVRILPGSQIRIVGSSVQLPVELVNELNDAVTVSVHLRTLSPIVIVDDPLTEVTIAAGSTQRVLVPVEVIGSGTTNAIVTVQTADGEDISAPVTLHVAAQPEIETVLLWIGAASVVLLLGFGLWRSLRKRAQGKAAGDLDVAAIPKRARAKDSGEQ